MPLHNPLLSVCMPTFRRIERCENAIRSIVAACDDPSKIEICLRVQIGDDASVSHIPEFLKLAPTVRIVVGLSYGGYIHHHLIFNDVARIADGKWIWMIDDDMTVERGSSGTGLDTIISSIRKDAILLPRIYHLGGSTYESCTDTPAVFFPSKAWNDFRIVDDGPPIDLAILGALRRRGYTTRFIDIAYHHHHDTPEEWKAHKEGVV